METTRRQVLAGGAAAAATLAHSPAFGGWEPSERYPDPRHHTCSTRALPNTGVAQCGRAARHRHALERGPGLVRRRALPAVERHPEQPDHALGRGRPARSAYSASPPTTPTATRATARAGWSPASTTPGASPAPSMTAPSPCCRQASTASGSIRPMMSWSKSDGSIWFTDPPFGILGNYEGHVADAGTADRTSTGSTRRPGAPTVVADEFPARTGWLLARRKKALRRRLRAPTPTRDPRLRRASTTAPSSPTAAPSITAGRRHAGRLPLSTSTAICGAAGASARPALDGVRRVQSATASRSATSRCPSAAPTSASAAASATACSWRRATRSIRST